MFVKVCGMRDAANIRAVEALPVDAMGFIFAPRSPRFVGEKPDYLPSRCVRVGVFVDADLDCIAERTSSFGLGAVQLHGRETPAFCHELRRVLPNGVRLLKALPIREAEDFRLTADYEDAVDVFLLETKASQPQASAVGPLDRLAGGTGRQFDWTLLQHYAFSLPFLLSGGITPGDAARIKALRHPRLLGVDLNSRFETAPAVKNVSLLKQFLSEIQ